MRQLRSIDQPQDIGQRRLQRVDGIAVRVPPDAIAGCIKDFEKLHVPVFIVQPVILAGLPEAAAKHELLPFPDFHTRHALPFDLDLRQRRGVFRYGIRTVGFLSAMKRNGFILRHGKLRRLTADFPEIHGDAVFLRRDEDLVLI